MRSALPERDVYYFVHAYRALPGDASDQARDVRLRRRLRGGGRGRERLRRAVPSGEEPGRGQAPARRLRGVGASVLNAPRCALALCLLALAAGCVGHRRAIGSTRPRPSGALRSARWRWRRSARSPRPPPSRRHSSSRYLAEALAARGIEVVAPEDVARSVVADPSAGVRELAAQRRSNSSAPTRCCSARSRAGWSARGSRSARCGRPRWACTSCCTARPAASGSGRASSTRPSRRCSENVLLTPRYPGGGTRWLTADEFARFARGRARGTRCPFQKSSPSLRADPRDRPARRPLRAARARGASTRRRSTSDDPAARGARASRASDRGASTWSISTARARASPRTRRRCARSSRPRGACRSRSAAACARSPTSSERLALGVDRVDPRHRRAARPGARARGGAPLPGPRRRRHRRARRPRGRAGLARGQRGDGARARAPLRGRGRRRARLHRHRARRHGSRARTSSRPPRSPRRSRSR